MPAPALLEGAALPGLALGQQGAVGHTTLGAVGHTPLKGDCTLDTALHSELSSVRELSGQPAVFGHSTTLPHPEGELGHCST